SPPALIEKSLRTAVQINRPAAIATSDVPIRIPQRRSTGRGYTRAGGRTLLPGLAGAAVRAGDGRRDGRAEQVAAAAGVQGAVHRPARVADAVHGRVAAAGGAAAGRRFGGGCRLVRRCRRSRGAVIVAAPPVGVALAQGVQKPWSHRSSFNRTSHTRKGFAVQPLFPVGGARPRARDGCEGGSPGGWGVLR